MSTRVEAMGKPSTGMGVFERYLTIWVGLGICAGVGLGLIAPTGFQSIAELEVAHVNLPGLHALSVLRIFLSSPSLSPSLSSD